MPNNNAVDLSPVLPALAAALKPFDDAVKRLDATPLSARPSDATTLANYAPLGAKHIGEMRKLVDAVNAVRRMAGEPV